MYTRVLTPECEKKMKDAIVILYTFLVEQRKENIT